ncbi:MAG: dihydrodipicolinate synthase family protein [Candidatus Marinimicrobia bacterium]|nr:dihydrodipicolinate synthase family protein [Candidatus Neomarinimicrobiota bacterium]
MGKLKSGIYTPLVTPFKDETIDYEALSRNISKLNNTEISGFVLLGSTGEAPLLNRKERLSVLTEAVKEAKRLGKNLVIGVMEESTKEALSFIEQTTEYLPDAYLVLPPTYYKPSIKGSLIKRFYSEINNYTSTDILLYNIPEFTAVNIESKTIIEMENDGVISGWKDSSSDVERFKYICSNINETFQNFIGNAINVNSGLHAGGTGGILAVANVIPTLCIELYNATVSGKTDESELVQYRINKFVKYVIRPFGISGLKAAMDYLGYNGGDLRRPYQTLDSIDLKTIAHFLESEGYI